MNNSIKKEMLASLCSLKPSELSSLSPVTQADPQIFKPQYSVTAVLNLSGDYLPMSRDIVGFHNWREEVLLVAKS